MRPSSSAPWGLRQLEVAGLSRWTNEAFRDLADMAKELVGLVVKLVQGGIAVGSQLRSRPPARPAGRRYSRAQTAARSTEERLPELADDSTVPPEGVDEGADGAVGCPGPLSS